MGKFNKGACTNIIHIINDCILAIVSFIFISIFCNIKLEILNGDKYIITCIIFMLIFILTNKESRIYNTTTFFYADRTLKFLTRSFLIASSITLLLIYYVGNSKIDRRFYLLFLGTTYICMIISAFITRIIVKNFSCFSPRTLLIGDINHFEKFESYLYKSNFDINLIGYVSINDNNNYNYIGNIKDLEVLIHDNAIDQIYIMHRRKYTVDIQHYINMCMDMGITTRIIMNSYKPNSAQSYVSSVGTYPVLTYHRISLNNSSTILKRIVDIAGSLTGIIIFSPVLLLTAICIKLDSKGPVIFKQERIGMNGRHFYMYKFRSMCIDAEEKKKYLMAQNEMEGEFMFKIQDDPRITKVGKFIRKTSIDELPQFFNILLGDMSLVGTRPPTLDEVEHYDRNHWRRMSIKPGLTGMWQVSGRSQITSFDEIVELDTEYIDKWSVFLDIKILLKTFIHIFTHNDAY